VTITMTGLHRLAAGPAREPGLASVRGYAEAPVGDDGGRWSVDEALANAVPVPAISAALYARFASRQEDSPVMTAIATLRNQFGGHEVLSS
jgi:6-phosphogluconate dehydrogenase